MNIPRSLKPALWGAIAGAAALALVGFTWGGWTTGGGAERSADNRATSAVVAALAPICLVQFQHASDATVKLGEIKKISSYNRADFVEKAGWATMPGSTSASAGVARSCAGLIASLN